ncbi:MAG: class A beta-lactamase, subclass A2 [Bacteroides sp.]|nr:class A beta-lactamase, subclass A2 [Bacteroides sp.]
MKQIPFLRHSSGKQLLFLAALLCVALPLRAQYPLLEQKIKEVTQGKQATVGVAVKIPGKEAITVNNEIEYPTMSVFKFHLALAVTDHLERNNLSPQTTVHIQKSDLMHDTYSPLRDKYPEADITLTLQELLYYTVSLSDNNTCDILFRYIGGTEKVDSYIRSLGIEKFSIAATEEEMHAYFPNQFLNWTAPSAAAELMELFLSGNLFTPPYQELLYTLLTETQTGLNKLKAGLPEDVILGHKTGSGMRTPEGVKVADNDLGFVVLPDGRSYCIGVFVKESGEDDETNAAMIAEISRIVYETLQGE